jgi:integrase/recombinase XerD
MNNSSYGNISLKNILIEGEAKIGLKASGSGQLMDLIQALPGVSYSNSMGLYYLPAGKESIGLVFKYFRGKAWINGAGFFH